MTLGDIEDVDAQPCIKCPWHQYLIRLKDGGKLYDSMVMDKATGKLKPGGWKTMPDLQRTHEVSTGSDGHVYIRIDTSGKEVRSDNYAHDGRISAAAFGQRLVEVDSEPRVAPP